MQVNIRLFGILRRRGAGQDPAGRVRLDLPEGTSLADLARPLDLPKGWSVLAVVDGEVSRPDRILREGDEVQIFPPVAGGRTGILLPLGRYPV
jgi:molybdopterin converting factor small subunit